MRWYVGMRWLERWNLPGLGIDVGRQTPSFLSMLTDVGVPGECVRCFTSTSVSPDWCDGCLDELRGVK